MIVLGFDPSLTNFGWALHDTDAEGSSRCLHRGRFQTSSKTLFVARYMDLRERVRDLLQEHKPDAVASESSVFGEMYSEGMYGLFLYVVEACYTEGVDLVKVESGITTKPMLIGRLLLGVGSGNASTE